MISSLLIFAFPFVVFPPLRLVVFNVYDQQRTGQLKAVDFQSLLLADEPNLSPPLLNYFQRVRAYLFLFPLSFC